MRRFCVARPATCVLISQRARPLGSDASVSPTELCSQDVCSRSPVIKSSNNLIIPSSLISSARMASSPVYEQRRDVSWVVSCDTKGLIVPPPRHIENRGKIKMHPMVRKFVDGVLNSESTSFLLEGSTPAEALAIMEANKQKGKASKSKESASESQNSSKPSSKKTYGDYDKSIKLSEAVSGDLKTGNLLLSGLEGTGKRTNMILAGEELEAAGKRVAWIGGDFFRVHSLGAIFMHYFFGLRVGDGIPIMEQMVGMFRRHALFMETSYERLFPSLYSADVLIFDSMQHVTPNMLKAMDKVAREIRRQPNLPFGGMKILAGANYWRMLRTSPASEFSGYTFQMPEMEQWFDHYFLTNVHHQKDPLLRSLTLKATFGELTMGDVKQLEQHSCAASKHQLTPTPFIDYAPASRVLSPTMCKHPNRRLLPAKIANIRRTDFGSFLGSVIGGPFTYSNTFSMPEKTTFEPGTPVHLVYATETVPVGEHGVVESVAESSIVVNFPRIRQSVPIPIARFRTHHVDYPEISVATLQFPLQNRLVTSGKFLVQGEKYWNIQIDGLYLTETNNLGVILNKMRTFDDFQMTNMDKYMKLEGMVHEATKLYCKELMATGRSDHHITLSGEEWCRNCKSHVPAADFFNHWKKCLKQLRWCTDCNKAIPLSKYPSHREKHQIVLCIDCAQPIEWKNWELHRLTCAPMMREISSENELLPERTRQVAMQYGLDRRDLHTVKKISKGNLPNARGAKRSNRKVKLEEIDVAKSREAQEAKVFHSLRPSE